MFKSALQTRGWRFAVHSDSRARIISGSRALQPFCPLWTAMATFLVHNMDHVRILFPPGSRAWSRSGYKLQRCLSLGRILPIVSQILFVIRRPKYNIAFKSSRVATYDEKNNISSEKQTIFANNERGFGISLPVNWFLWKPRQGPQDWGEWHVNSRAHVFRAIHTLHHSSWSTLCFDSSLRSSRMGSTAVHM